MALSGPGRVMSSVSTGTGVGPPALGLDPTDLETAYGEAKELQQAGAWGRVGPGEADRIKDALEAPLGLAMSAMRDPGAVSRALVHGE